MRSRLAALGVPEGKRILGINPGATFGSAKRWFPDRFAEVAEALSEEWDTAVVLMGSVPEIPLSMEIEAAMRRKPVNLAGRTTVRELMSLLASCTFLVTNDSGPMHWACRSPRSSAPRTGKRPRRGPERRGSSGWTSTAPPAT